MEIKHIGQMNLTTDGCYMNITCLISIYTFGLFKPNDSVYNMLMFRDKGIEIEFYCEQNAGASS